MEPAAWKRQQQFNAVWIRRIGDLLAMKFNLMNGGIDQLFFNAVIGKVGQHVKNNGFNLVGRCLFDIFQPADKQRVPVVGVEAAAIAQGAAQPGVDQRFAQGRRRIAQQDLLQQCQGQNFKRVLDIGGQPGDAHLVFMGRIFVFIERVRIGWRSRLLPAGLGRDIGIRVNLFELPEHLGFDKSQMVFERQVAVGIEKGVAGVIVLPVKFFELFIGEGWNLSRLASRIKLIGGWGIERF